MTRLARFELLGLICAGSVAAGVHAAIAPEHLHEWPPLGASFVAIAASLATAIVALAFRPTDRRIAAALAPLLGAVATGYAVTRLAPIPPLDPEREPLDALGVCTTAVEALGLLLALHLSRHTSTQSQGGRQ